VFLILLVLCILGLAGGMFLLRSIPLCPESQPASFHHVSIIIPARNEEKNLPRLLDSIRTSQLLVSPEVIVVDDESTDGTSAVAVRGGAKVVVPGTPPAGWTGKTWACAQGARAAQGSLFLFLDADTWFSSGGLPQLLSAWEQHSGERIALSVLPFHTTHAPYEKLSLFFNLLMAFGAGGFGGLGKPKLFGQCLLISRDLYEACGGHGAVRGRVLENLAMADRIEAAGARCVCLGGGGSIYVRMFPEGLAQLCESWKKAFADGAAASDSAVLTLSVVWLSALCTIFLLLLASPWALRGFAALLYLVAAAQVYRFARQIGAFGIVTALCYPIPLLFFFGLFATSLMDRMLHREVTWRGRTV
jgi:4,4'-diaponeurosporenoate glycosyltransferase